MLEEMHFLGTQFPKRFVISSLGARVHCALRNAMVLSLEDESNRLEGQLYTYLLVYASMRVHHDF